MADRFGDANNNNLQGTGESDRLFGGGGNDTLSGRGGTDTAFYQGTRDDYRADVLSNGNLTITDLRTGSPNGADTVLPDVESFAFFTDTITTSVTYTSAAVRNDRPRAANDTVQVTENGGTLPASAVLGNDTDFDPGDTLSLVSVANNASGGNVALVNGQLVYTPAAGFELGACQTATDSFTYTVRGAAGLPAPLRPS